MTSCTCESSHAQGRLYLAVVALSDWSEYERTVKPGNEAKIAGRKGFQTKDYIPRLLRFAKPVLKVSVSGFLLESKF